MSMREPEQEHKDWRHDKPALLLALIAGLVHLLLAGRYDLFRDELYFIVCGQHPAFGYADQPPLVPLAAATLYALGGTAFWVRLPIVIAAAGLVFITVRLVRLVEGSHGAALAAGLAAAIAPVLMGMSAILSTSSFDPLAFTLIALLLVRAVRLGEDRALLLCGLAAGLILQVKYALVLWAIGLACGLLLTPQRKLLRRAAFWQGLALAAAIALPSLVWQAANGFPFLALSAAAGAKNADVALLPFIANQLFILNPLLAPLWIAGLVAPFASRRFADLRFIAIAYFVTFAIVRLGHGKDYYLAALYPALFAIGAAWIGAFLQKSWQRRAAAGWGVLAVTLSALVMPLALPILPPATLKAYIAATGLAPQQQEKSFAGAALPQVFADQLGWHDFSDQVMAAWRKVPLAERSATGILADNYGEAAAIDLYGRGLPPALSGHNQYGLWGQRGQAPRNLLVITDEPEQLADDCAFATVLEVTSSPLAMPEENGKAIALCLGLKRPLSDHWPALLHFG